MTLTGDLTALTIVTAGFGADGALTGTASPPLASGAFGDHRLATAPATCAYAVTPYDTRPRRPFNVAVTGHPVLSPIG